MKKLLVALSVCLLSVFLFGCDAVPENNPTSSTTTATTTTTTEATTNSITTTTTTTEKTTISATTTTTETTTTTTTVVPKTTTTTTKVTTSMKNTTKPTTTAKTTKTTTSKTTTTTKTTITFVDEPIPSFAEDFSIYRIDRDHFEFFLEQPSFGIIKHNVKAIYAYPQNGERYMRWNATVFPVKQELVSFTRNKLQLEHYLAQNGVEEDVHSTILFDAPRVPLTVWVKTEKSNRFITINECLYDYIPLPEGVDYEYVLYDEAAYREKFRQRDGKLIVKGTDMTGQVPFKLYYRYAELPMVAVLQKLGAKVEYQSDTLCSIELNNKTFFLDLSQKTLTEEGKENDNLLTKIVGGGPYYISVIGDELLVDDGVFRVVMNHMGSTCTVNIDMDNEMVTIA